jgi:hypothetical protein
VFTLRILLRSDQKYRAPADSRIKSKMLITHQKEAVKKVMPGVVLEFSATDKADIFTYVQEKVSRKYN